MLAGTEKLERRCAINGEAGEGDRPPHHARDFDIGDTAASNAHRMPLDDFATALQLDYDDARPLSKVAGAALLTSQTGADICG
jgi:hypothetical protein